MPQTKDFFAELPNLTRIVVYWKSLSHFPLFAPGEGTARCEDKN